MAKWDYLVQSDSKGMLSGRGTATDFIDYLNEKGKEDWELVATVAPKEVSGIKAQWLVFKRPAHT